MRNDPPRRPVSVASVTEGRRKAECTSPTQPTRPPSSAFWVLDSEHAEGENRSHAVANQFMPSRPPSSAARFTPQQLPSRDSSRAGAVSTATVYELPPVLPSQRVRTPRHAAAGAPPISAWGTRSVAASQSRSASASPGIAGGVSSTSAAGKQSASLADDVCQIRAGLEKVKEQAGRLAQRRAGAESINGPPSHFEEGIANALDGQLRAEVGCLSWISHALTERGASAAQARMHAARSLHQWRFEAEKLQATLCPKPQRNWLNDRRGFRDQSYSSGSDSESPTHEMVSIQEVGHDSHGDSQQNSSIRSLEDEVGHKQRLQTNAIANSHQHSAQSSRRNSVDPRAFMRETVIINVLVPEPERRGVSAAQLRKFFYEHCGDMLYENDDCQKPVCIPSKLAELAVKQNLLDAKSGHRNILRETNMYTVNELLICPHTKEEGISYSEKLNPSGLLIDFFISHHWGEDFGEFTQGALRHSSQVAAALKEWGKAGDAVAYWCSAFSNNQHQVNVGETLQESPFFIALSSEHCVGTVLNMNQLGSALCRIWCIYEIYLTRTLKKEFVINSSHGPLMNVTPSTRAKDMWVMHIFRLLQHISVAQADATCDDDRLKILNFIESLKNQRDDSGIAVLDNSVKALVAEQIMFTMVRLGDADCVQKALELNADPNGLDPNGIRPLVYAAANNHEVAVQLLQSYGADSRATKGAREVLAIWSTERKTRERAFKELAQFDFDTTHFHKEAIYGAKKMHGFHCVAEYAPLLDHYNVEMRLHAVRGLGEHGIACGMYANKLVYRLADNDERVQKAAVETLGQMENFDVNKCGIFCGMISHANLERVLCHSETQSNLMHLAAQEPSGHAFHVLVHAVRWTRLSPALTMKDSRDRTIVHLAAAAGHFQCVYVLVDEQHFLPRAMLLEADADGRNAIHYAAESGEAINLRLFLDMANAAPADLQRTDHEGMTAAHVATKAGHLECLSVLIKEGKLPLSALTMQDASGSSVLHIAAHKGNTDILCMVVKELEKLGPEEMRAALSAGDRWHRTPFHVGVLGNLCSVVRKLRDLKSPVHLPMGPRLPEIGSVALVAKKADCPWRLGRLYWGPDRKGNMKFEYENGQRDQGPVKKDQCQFAPTPFILAEKLGHDQISELLKKPWKILSEELREEGRKDNELWRQARKGCLPAGVLAAISASTALCNLVSREVLSREDLLEPDFEGCTSWHKAAASGDPETVETIVKIGQLNAEDLVRTDFIGQTAIHHSALSDNADCLQAVHDAMHLCDTEAVLSDRDIWGRSPAHTAAATGALETLCALEKLGAPMFLPMAPKDVVNPKQLSLGTMVLVRQLNDGGQKIGVIEHLFEDDQMMRVRYEDSCREGFVDVDRCTISPDPLQLAEGFGHDEVIEFLRKLPGCPVHEAHELPVPAPKNDKKRASKLPNKRTSIAAVPRGSSVANASRVSIANASRVSIAPNKRGSVAANRSSMLRKSVVA